MRLKLHVAFIWSWEVRTSSSTGSSTPTHRHLIVRHSHHWVLVMLRVMHGHRRLLVVMRKVYRLLRLIYRRLWIRNKTYRRRHEFLPVHLHKCTTLLSEVVELLIAVVSRVLRLLYWLLVVDGAGIELLHLRLFRLRIMLNIKHAKVVCIVVHIFHLSWFALTVRLLGNLILIWKVLMQLVVLRLRRRSLGILLLKRIVFESAMLLWMRRVHPWLFFRSCIRAHRFLFKSLLSFFYTV